MTAAANSTRQAAVIEGAALGGLLYALEAQLAWAVAGARKHSGAMWICVCAVLLLAIALVLNIRHRAEPISRTSPGISELTAGTCFIWSRPVMLSAISSLDLFAVLLGGAASLLPIFAKDILHAGP